LSFNKNNRLLGPNSNQQQVLNNFGSS